MSLVSPDSLPIRTSQLLTRQNYVIMYPSRTRTPIRTTTPWSARYQLPIPRLGGDPSSHPTTQSGYSSPTLSSPDTLVRLDLSPDILVRLDLSPARTQSGYTIYLAPHIWFVVSFHTLGNLRIVLTESPLSRLGHRFPYKCFFVSLYILGNSKT